MGYGPTNSASVVQFSSSTDVLTQLAGVCHTIMWMETVAAKDYWVVPDAKDVRPYAVLMREC